MFTSDFNDNCKVSKMLGFLKTVTSLRMLRYIYFSVTQQTASVLIKRGIDTNAFIKKIIQTLT